MKYVEGSIECVAMVDETTFVSGGDSGSVFIFVSCLFKVLSVIFSSSISLWMTAKKKPIFTQPLAHSLNELVSETEGVIRTPRWVTALACLRYSDLFASGEFPSLKISLNSGLI